MVLSPIPFRRGVVAITISPRVALAVLFAALVVVTAGSIVTTELISRDQGPDPAFHFVELEDGTVLWPHHSTAPDYTTRTLSITVVIYGDAPATERLLMEQGIGDWEELPEDQEDIELSETPTATEGAGTAWDPAGGAVRYIYLEPADGSTPHWTGADYQLRDGDYLGSRHHIRAYVDPVDGNWTVIQAHREHGTGSDCDTPFTASRTHRATSKSSSLINRTSRTSDVSTSATIRDQTPTGR